MVASDDKVTLQPGYVLGQLERALQTASAHPELEVRERARARVEKWLAVLEGMSSGALAIGSRTPTEAPAWATLEVAHGGFATGALVAAGPVLPHERALAARLGTPADDRRMLALHFLSDAGREELRAMLASGRFRVEVPEEGALLSIAALLARGHAEGAAAILDAITPYLDRLRFHPQPSSRAIAPVSTVHVATIGETRAKMAALETPLAVRRMNEALAIWAPLTDRAADLVLETVVDGEPCRALPEGWAARARTLLADHATARATHRLCAKPHHPKENLAILVSALARLVAPDAPLSPRELGLVRVALAGHVRKHGAPGSERRRARRESQTRVASLPTRGESARVASERLAQLPADGALVSLEEVGAPLSTGEHAGLPLWPTVAAKLDRCLEASIEELVERGILTSGEAIARVLPQVSAHVRAMGFADPEVARLYASIDAAFRRRRSLLLLRYASQVKLEELPWLAALEPLRTDDGTSSEGARRLFASVSALAIESFPHAIVPNPLLQELRGLAQRAGIELPIVDELAADIFMGGFTAKFVRAAEIVADRLEGTVYARYYALPIDAVRTIARSLDPSRASIGERLIASAAALLGRTPVAPTKGPVPAFGALCERRAELEPGLPRSVARNGRVIEQQQILTTQNLVPLIVAARLSNERFPDLAQQTFEWLIGRVQMRAPERVDRLRAAKNAAYAWRQMIAFLSLSPDGAVDAFLETARAHLAAQPAPFRARFEPLFEGLESAHAGRAPEVRLLGWSTGPHPLVD